MKIGSGRSMTVMVQEAAKEKFGNQLYARYGEGCCRRANKTIKFIDEQIGRINEGKLPIIGISNICIQGSLESSNTFKKMQNEIINGRCNIDAIEKVIKAQNHLYMIPFKMDELIKKLPF